MSGYVNVRPEVLTCAVRYALGRRSYIVGTIADQVRSTWNDLDGAEQQIITDDLAEWLDRADANAADLGKWPDRDTYQCWSDLWHWCLNRRREAAAAASGSEADA